MRFKMGHINWCATFFRLESLHVHFHQAFGHLRPGVKSQLSPGNNHSKLRAKTMNNASCTIS
uniref:Uncharacterized protein n=2 Tax=Anguilla anguilla TaxID=7936 RepID=A0A0E9S1Z5_ANGAN